MMHTLVEIEAAIERLPEPDVAELSRWLRQKRSGGQAKAPAAGGEVSRWLGRARGGAKPGVTTEQVLALTRDET
jgi:hypothetical protein